MLLALLISVSVLVLFNIGWSAFLGNVSAVALDMVLCQSCQSQSHALFYYLELAPTYLKRSDI